MKKLSIILILSTFLFSTVSNNGATLTIDSGVGVYVNGELVNNGTVNNEGFLQVDLLSGSGAITGSGTVFNTSQIILGDVYADGELNISDLVMGLQIILGNTIPTYEQTYALDYNQDGSNDVLDIVSMVDFILNTQTRNTNFLIRK